MTKIMQAKWCLFGRKGIIWNFGIYDKGVLYFDDETNFPFDGDISTFDDPSQMLEEYIKTNYSTYPYDKARDFLIETIKKRFSRRYYGREHLFTEGSSRKNGDSSNERALSGDSIKNHARSRHGGSKGSGNEGP
jgi:hypothetical protein